MVAYATAQDTSFNDVDDTLIYQPVHIGSTLQFTATDADQQTIHIQREQGGFNSGSWVTVKTFATGGSATFDWSTQNKDNSRYRFYLAVDNGGSNTVTITEHTVQKAAFRDEKGQALLVFDSFAYDHLVNNSRQAYFSDTKIGATETASFTATSQEHAGRVTKLDASGGALTITLPSSTGTLDEYTFMSVVDPGTNDIVISCDTDGGAFLGAIHVMTDGSAPTPFASDQSGNDLITLNNTTTGGLGVGDWITVKDVGTNLWMVWGQVVSSGSEATPFSGS